MAGEKQIIDQIFVEKIPQGDDRIRNVCQNCDFVDYQNPKIVVGSVATWQTRFLLCRRAIEPRKGFWTLPAGYLEIGESVEQGALREAWEEAGISLDLDQLLAVYSVPRISQVQIFFRAKMITADYEAGPESEEVELFEWDDLPWSELAFPTVHWALDHWLQVQELSGFPPFSNPLGYI